MGKLKLEKLIPNKKMKDKSLSKSSIEDIKQYTPILMSKQRNGELIKLGEFIPSLLPQAIVFDLIPLSNGTYINNVPNVYSHIVNSEYAGGAYNPATPEEAVAIISTIEYVFTNRVKYLVMISVQNAIRKMKKRFYDINELELYEILMYRIDNDFGDIIYHLESYIGDKTIITENTVTHIVVSIDTTFYNCLLKAMVGYQLDSDGYQFISDIVFEFDAIFGEYFRTYILTEVECIYGPQLETIFKKIAEFNTLELDKISF